MVPLQFNSSAVLLEENERFFLLLSNPVPVSVSDVRFADGNMATVVITDISGTKTLGLDYQCIVDIGSSTSCDKLSHEIITIYSVLALEACT